MPRHTAPSIEAIFHADQAQYFSLMPPTLRGAVTASPFTIVPEFYGGQALEALLPLSHPIHRYGRSGLGPSGPLGLTDAVLAKSGLPFMHPASLVSIESHESRAGPSHALPSDSSGADGFVPVESLFSRPASPAGSHTSSPRQLPSLSAHLASLTETSYHSALSLEHTFSEADYDADFDVSHSLVTELSSFEALDPTEAFSDSEDGLLSRSSRSEGLTFSSLDLDADLDADSQFGARSETRSEAGSICSDPVLLAQPDIEAESDDEADDETDEEYVLHTPDCSEKEERELAFLRRTVPVSLLQCALPLSALDEELGMFCDTGLAFQFVENAVLKRPEHFGDVLDHFPSPPKSPQAALAGRFMSDLSALMDKYSALR